MATADDATTRHGASDASSRPWPDIALWWSSRMLVAIVWISSAIFGVYILALYLGAVAEGTLTDWNDGFPGLYGPRSLAANIGIGVHFAFGAILLLLGPVQLISGIRSRWPAVHRWMGRAYAAAAFVTGLGGLTFIVGRGTVGGPVMNVGFALYGGLMVMAAFQTVRFAVARRLVQHRAWAIRLFALAIGSWLYRMDYGFWRLLTNGAGHTKNFDGWFDVIMVFWFYLPNLVVAEIFIRGRQHGAGWSLKWTAAAVMMAASIVLFSATVMITIFGWGPAILWRLGIIDC